MNIVSLLGDGGLVVAGAGATTMVFWIVAIVLSVFWIWMLIDCVTSSLPPMEKLIWFLVIFFLHILGALIYFFVARQGRRPGMV